MKVSYNWIKQYLPIDLPAEKVAEILTDTGLEVEGLEQIESIPGGLAGLVVGEVKTAEQHPNADRLRVTTVDVGGAELLNIVCGAPNVAAGQKVVVATVGTMLYPTEGDPFKIKKGKIRGEVSLGMICAEDEIGLGTDHDGIMVLPAETPVGTPAKEVFNVETDYIFEIGLTPNRSDALGHIGVARDIYAALRIHHDFKGNLQLPDVSDFKVENTDLPIPVTVENTEACPRYSGVSITGVTIKNSPEWLQNRLNAIGVRPINNIVDITNYILHETGQPLHAFDADQIAGQTVVVKTLPKDAVFVSLDEQERKLHEDDLMICNANGEGMCIAGVFGGIHSGVTEQTTNIFLESACFHPIRTRRTASRHHLRTDAAIRFEKGVDPNNTVFVLKRAALLIQELAGGQIASEIVDVYPEKVKRKVVPLRYKQLDRLVGISIPRDQVKKILAALAIEVVEETAAGLTVKVGTNRADVYREADVIEEVLRIYGLNNVPMPSHIKSSMVFSEGLDQDKVYNTMADFLAANGFNEMMATSISQQKYYQEGQKGIVHLLNSLNADLDVMRPSMLFSGLEAVAHNLNHKNANLRLFEFGKMYSCYDKESITHYEEQQHLSLFVTGKSTEENWQQAQQDTNFFTLKNTVLQALNRLGINSYKLAEYQNEQWIFAQQYKLGKQVLATLGQVQPKVLKKMGIKQPVFYADFAWDVVLQVLRNKKLKVTDIPKYPSVRRDLALLLDKKVTFAEIEQIATKGSKKILQSVNLFDIYEDETKIGKDKKSYAVSFVFQDAKKTLTDKEVDKVINKLVNSFERQLGASLR